MTSHDGAAAATPAERHAAARILVPPPDDAPDAREEPRAHYRGWLDHLDDELVAAALVITEAAPRITRGLLAADRSVREYALSAFSDVSERCRYLDEQTFLLLAREAPVSGDLRRLVSIVRLVSHLVRAAAALRHVGMSVEGLDARLLPQDLQLALAELASRAVDVLARGVDAWRRRDALAANELDRADADVDVLSHRLEDQARQLDGTGAEILVLGLLSRYLERLADHGVAFAQHATFAVTGEHVDLRV